MIIHCKSIFCSQAIITPLHKKQNTESTTVEKDFHCNKIPAPPVVWERNILVQPEECNNHDKDDNADTFDYHSYYNTDIHKPRHHWHTDNYNSLEHSHKPAQHHSSYSQCTHLRTHGGK